MEWFARFQFSVPAVPQGGEGGTVLMIPVSAFGSAPAPA